MSDTAQTVDFRELLKTNTDEVERMKSLPAGQYKGVILGHEFGRTKGKQTPYVRFNILPKEGIDVDEELLKGVDLSTRTQRDDYFLTPKAMGMLADMLDAVLGKESGRNFDERIPDTTGVEVQFGLAVRLNQDGTDSGYNEVTKIVAVH